jgi:hypothetical protein
MKDRLTIRPATVEDATYLAPRLRKADLVEAERAGYPDVTESLCEAVLEGTTTLTVVDPSGVPQAIGGLHRNPDVPHIGTIWLVTTDEFVRRHRREFLRRIRPILAELCRSYDTVWNMVDADNDVHIRWLRWAGFNLSEPVIRAPGDHPFHILTWRQRQCAFQ